MTSRRLCFPLLLAGAAVGLAGCVGVTPGSAAEATLAEIQCQDALAIFTPVAESAEVGTMDADAADRTLDTLSKSKGIASPDLAGLLAVGSTSLESGDYSALPSVRSSIAELCATY